MKLAACIEEERRGKKGGGARRREEEEEIQPQAGLGTGFGPTSFTALACLEPEINDPDLIAPKKKEFLS